MMRRLAPRKSLRPLKMPWFEPDEVNAKLVQAQVPRIFLVVQSTRRRRSRRRRRRGSRPS